MRIPERKDCIHNPVCRYSDEMCVADCGYYEALSSDAVSGRGREMTDNEIKQYLRESLSQILLDDDYNIIIELI